MFHSVFKKHRADTTVTNSLDVEPQPAVIFDALDQLVAAIIRGEFAVVLADNSSIARSLAPLVKHLQNANFDRLRALADIWVTQTAPLLGMSRTEANMKELGDRT